MLSHSRLDSARAEAPSHAGGDGEERDLRLRLQSRILSASLHESRGSLVAILGYARLLLEAGALADSPEEREYLQIILANAQSMSLQLKTLSRLISSDDLTLGKLDFGELWAGVVHAMGLRMAARSLRFKERLPGRALPIAGDAVRLAGAIRDLWDEIIICTLPDTEIAAVVSAEDRQAVVLITSAALPGSRPSIISCRVEEIIRLHGGSLSSKISADRALAVTLVLPLL